MLELSIYSSSGTKGLEGLTPRAPGAPAWVQVARTIGLSELSHTIVGTESLDSLLKSLDTIAGSESLDS